MRKRLFLPVLLALSLLLSGCGGPKSTTAAAGETVHTALFDFTVSDVQVVENYGDLTPADGDELVQMTLTVTNTSDTIYTMFKDDFQIQWGDGDEDFGTALAAVDDNMIPAAYPLSEGQSHTGVMVAEVPAGTKTLTVAYQEMLSDGSKGDTFFVEAAL